MHRCNGMKITLVCNDSLRSLQLREGNGCVTLSCLNLSYILDDAGCHKIAHPSYIPIPADHKLCGGFLSFLPPEIPSLDVVRKAEVHFGPPERIPMPVFERDEVRFDPPKSYRQLQPGGIVSFPCRWPPPRPVVGFGEVRKRTARSANGTMREERDERTAQGENGARRERHEG